jgi:hypothetical protein
MHHISLYFYCFHILVCYSWFNWTDSGFHLHVLEYKLEKVKTSSGIIIHHSHWSWPTTKFKCSCINYSSPQHNEFNGYRKSSCWSRIEDAWEVWAQVGESGNRNILHAFHYPQPWKSKCNLRMPHFNFYNASVIFKLHGENYCANFSSRTMGMRNWLLFGSFVHLGKDVQMIPLSTYA